MEAVIPVITAVLGTIVGVAGTYLKLRAQFEKIEHEKAVTKQLKDSLQQDRANESKETFEKRIAVLKERLAGARPEERQELEDRLRGVQDEYDRWLQNYINYINNLEEQRRQSTAS